MKMKKTPLQELIEWIDRVEMQIPHAVILTAHSLLEQEKKTIIQAYEKGASDEYNRFDKDNTRPIHGIEFFRQNFEQ